MKKPSKQKISRVPLALADDDGRIMVLSLGFVVLVIMMLFVLVAVSSLHLERNRLQTLADNLATGAAQEITMLPVTTSADTPPNLPAPTQQQVEAFLREEIAGLPESTRRSLPGLRLVSVTLDHRTVSVRLEARGELPVLPPAVSRLVYPVRLEASGSARGNLYSQP